MTPRKHICFDILSAVAGSICAVVLVNSISPLVQAHTVVSSNRSASVNCASSLQAMKAFTLGNKRITAFSSMRHALLVDIAKNDVSNVATLVNQWKRTESPLDIQEALQSGLSMASSFGHVQMVKTLIRLGAKPDTWTNRTNRSTAIADAAACGHLNVIKAILAGGGHIDAKGAVYGSIGTSNAFDAALDGLHPIIAIWLVHHGFDVCKNVAPKKLIMLQKLVKSHHMPDELQTMLECRRLDASIHTNK
ncbi:MAG TPA: ankyrin repeat domain-containing protein [Rhodanobacteraceae bacterium]